MSRRSALVLLALCCVTSALAMYFNHLPTTYAGSASTPPAAPGTPTSDFLKSLQLELKRAGYDPGVIDGKMGPTTRYALRQFQQAQGLHPTGTPDIPTMTRLLGRGLPP